MHTFITGGAGFIGCNTAALHLSKGRTVTVYDNLSRPRTQHNLDWLSHEAPRGAGAELRFVQGDTRDFAALAAAVRDRLARAAVR